MELGTSLKALPGIGPRLSFGLEKLELRTVEDLIHHYPFRYDDFSATSNISEAKEGEVLTVKGQIWSIKNVYTRGGKVLTRAILNDGTSSIELIWFNQTWLPKSIHVSDYLQASGKVGRSGSTLTLVVPKWEKIAELPKPDEALDQIKPETIHTGRLVPIYPETFGLTSKWLRAKIAEVLPQVLPQVDDVLPEQIRGQMKSLPDCLSQIHFPTDISDLKAARERLSFDELFFIQLATLKTRHDWQQKRLTKPLEFNDKLRVGFIKNLPFALTNAQIRVIGEIANDLKRDQPMNRLVQGEVGSGKTVVAAAIAYLVALNKLKTLIMAPTEILAFQHYSTFSRLLEPYGIKVGLFTGSKKTVSSKKRVVKGEAPMVIVGTHALVSKNFEAQDVGLVVIDEQQRFGVEQRAILRSHAKVPHFLTMTATPIPRTVALTLYGDLDISVIDELPPNRIQVKTHFVPEKKRDEAYKFIEKKVKEGDQVYLVTPLIEESETLASAKAAKVEYEHLRTKIFPNLKLGLLHGRLHSKEKEAVINAFKNGEFDILVSTSVVEVGVDVSNATIIVIEGAERFGLSQLHQLRGRVGRGTKESFCFLFAEAPDSAVIRRLKNLERITNGLKLAELDLQIRGSGEVFGTRQSGRFNLKIASLSDLPLVEKTRRSAQTVLEEDPSLDKYPNFKRKLADLVANATPD